jgi:saccharopepsin
LQVSDSNNPVLQFGAVGILGLGFTSLSFVDQTVERAGSDWGRSFLQNVFAQDTSKPNYIAFLLERTSDRSEIHPGSFTIGELEPDLANAISATQRISTWPVSQPKRWSVLLDGYEFADGIKRTLTTAVEGAPSAVVLLDTGASYSYAPESLVTELYGNIPGASFNPSMGMWSVPCDQQVNIAFWIGYVR